MQGVVFAAGEGTRMRPLTADRPKGLVDVAGKPLLSWCFDALVEAGVAEIVVVVGYRAADVIDHYGDVYDGASAGEGDDSDVGDADGGVPLTYAHQREQRGLADALLAATPHLDGDVLAINGDNVCRANVASLADRHRETDADATLLVEEVSRAAATRGSAFRLDDDGAIVGLVEKPDDPPSTLVPRGVYAFSPAIHHACRLVEPGVDGERQLSAAVDLLLRAGRRVETVPLEGWCVNVNEPEDRERVAALLESE